MKSNLSDKLFLALFSKQTEVAELLLGALGVFWGSWVANPFWDTFSLHSYAGFLMFPELWFGLFIMSVGILTIAGALSRNRIVRSIALFLNMVFWMFVALLFLVNTPENTAFPVYTMVSFMSIWLYIRLVIFQDIYDELFLLIRKHM